MAPQIAIWRDSLYCRVNQLAMAVEKALASCPAPSTTVSKVQERPGRSLREALGKGNPFHWPSCGRKFCPLVARGEECQGMCYREGVGYLATCNLCIREQLAAGVEEEDVVHRVYTGESHRSLRFRLERHIDDYRPLLRKRRGGGCWRGRGEVKLKLDLGSCG